MNRKGNRKKKVLINWGLLLISLLTILVIALSIIRSYKVRAIYQNRVAAYNPDLVRQWLLYTKNNREGKSIKTANKIVMKQLPYVPYIEYMEVADAAGVNINFFFAPFSILDFLHWKDMFYIKERIVEIRKNRDKSRTDPICKKIFFYVADNIKLEKKIKEKKIPPFFSLILKRGHGSLLEKYMLFLVMAMEAGYKGQLLSIYYSNKHTLIGLFAAVLDEKGREVIFDFLNKKIFYGDILQFIKRENLIKRLKLPDKPIYIVYETVLPAFFYKKNNQLLNDYIRKADKNAPIITINPKRYREDFIKAITKTKNMFFIFNVEPFYMIKNSKYYIKYIKY